MMTKHETVMALHAEQRSEDYKYFEAGEEGEARTDGYYMANQVFEDMGSPEQITVRVVPGDQLNPKSTAEAIFGETKVGAE